MANAAINIMGDGSTYDVVTMGGDVADIQTRRINTGVYEVTGTLGMVPPPDGWGTVTNPVDQINASLTYQDSVLTLHTFDHEEQPIDIPSKVTLHILVPDAPPPQYDAPPAPDPHDDLEQVYRQRRAHADAVIQSLQDLIDIGEGTAEIEERVLEWKRYRVGLNQIAHLLAGQGDVQWPVQPE